MTVEREKPKSGEWSFNAQTAENSRVQCLEEAERLEAAGKPKEAAEMRRHAEMCRRDRDAIQREYERLILNRRIRRGG